MKTGELYDGDENPAANYDDATESHFTIELSNGAFATILPATQSPSRPTQAPSRRAAT